LQTHTVVSRNQGVVVMIMTANLYKNRQFKLTIDAASSSIASSSTVAISSEENVILSKIEYDLCVQFTHTCNLCVHESRGCVAIYHIHSIKTINWMKCRYINHSIW
jgi:hypothetical protein